MRSVVVGVLLAACGAQLGGGGGGSDNPADAHVDSHAIDAAIDARPCTGGDAHLVGPHGECLVMFTTPRTYVDAKAACAAINAHLAYLTDAQLDAAAETFVGSANTFIGLTDRAVEGTFVWDDGTPLGYSNWHTGEPNNGGSGGYQEDCAIIAGARVGAQWDDRPCDASEVPTSGTFAYLCQY
ncbi:MAG TPA: lectin-like protein [Kofleriaceae bacterium]|nr:lectin-like protein [Kofleriaceae bacterium]